MLDGPNHHILVELSPYAFSFFFSILLFIICIKSWKRNEVKAFIVYLSGQIVWVFGYMFELTAESIEGKFWWDNFQFIGYLIIGFGYPLFILLYTNYLRRFVYFSFILFSVLSISLLVSIIIGDPHGWDRFDSQLIIDSPFDALHYQFGLISQLINIFIYLNLVLMLLSLFKFQKNQRGMLKKQTQSLIIGTLIPAIGGLISILGVFSFRGNRDTSPFYFLISNIVIFIGLFRFGLFATYESILPHIVDNLNDGILIIDEHRMIVGINAPAKQMLSVGPNLRGYSIEKSLKKYPELVKLAKLPFEFGKKESIELDLFSRGSLRKFNVVRHPIFNVWRNLSGFFIILQDIHDSKLVEAQLKKEKAEISEQASKEKEKLEAQLQQAQKMETIGRLAGGIAHDFNNMLTGIMGNIELLKLTVDENQEAIEYVNEIESAAKSAANLTRSLLSFSRKQMVNPERINLNDIVKSISKMIQRVIGEDIQFNLNLDDAIPDIIADPSSIQQALLNLVVNARDAMPKGGTLVIETKNCYLNQTYCDKHILETSGNYVLLAVSDTGTGMSEEVKSHLFEPFFTTKGKEKGTGLGLALVYGTVIQAGGRIEVYSELNYGTTFKLYFPIADPEYPVKPRNHELTLLENNFLQIIENNENTNKKLASNEKLKTLALVEDDAKVRNVIIQGLVKHGYNVLSYSDPVEAYEHLKLYKREIDLLIADVVMPKMNGKELASQLSKYFPNMKVLYISGYTENVIFHHGVLDAGVNFLSKPFTPEILIQTIKKIIG